MIPISKSDAKAVHPLARFVTVEAIALLLNLNPHEIYRIDCWRYVIHVVGKGLSSSPTEVRGIGLRPATLTRS